MARIESWAGAITKEQRAALRYLLDPQASERFLGETGLARNAAHIAVGIHGIFHDHRDRHEIVVRTARAVLELNGVAPSASMDDLLSIASIDADAATGGTTPIRERLENELAIAIARAARRS